MDWWIVFPVVFVVIIALWYLLQLAIYLTEAWGVYWRGVSAGETENRDENGFVKQSLSSLTIDSSYRGLKAVAFRKGYISMYRKGRP